jgi:hypothetical protein
MERQAHTGGTELVKSREMTDRNQKLPWWLGRGGVKTTGNQIHCFQQASLIWFGYYSARVNSLVCQLLCGRDRCGNPPTSQNSQKLNNWDNLLACLLLCSTFCPYMLPTLMFTPPPSSSHLSFPPFLYRDGILF